MKIEMPQEPWVDRLWLRHREIREVTEWKRSADELHPAKWVLQAPDQPFTAHRWHTLLNLGTVYTTHPDLEALEKYPAPWLASRSGTIRASDGKGGVGKVVLDPTLQCPPCLTALIVRAVNEFAERNAVDPGPKEDEKR